MRSRWPGDSASQARKRCSASRGSPMPRIKRIAQLRHPVLHEVLRSIDLIQSGRDQPHRVGQQRLVAAGQPREVPIRQPPAMRVRSARALSQLTKRQTRTPLQLREGLREQRVGCRRGLEESPDCRSNDCRGGGTRNSTKHLGRPISSNAAATWSSACGSSGSSLLERRAWSLCDRPSSARSSRRVCSASGRNVTPGLGLKSANISGNGLFVVSIMRFGLCTQCCVVA